MAGLAQKPPIEPLPERTWNAIEAKVFERLDEGLPATHSPRPAVSGWAALTLAAVALATSVFALIRISESETVSRADELVARRAPVEQLPGAEVSTSSQQAARNSEDARQYIVTTTGGTTANLGDSRLTIAHHSEVVITGNEDEGWQVLLENGEVHFEVPPRRERSEFVVRAGAVIVRVVGTKFDVSRRAERALVAVQRGRVRVEYSGRTSVLEAGETWAQPATPVNADKPSKAPASRADDSVRLEQRAKPSARDEFERAASLESTNPGEALEIYRRLSSEPGPWSANALYARARLMLEQGRSAQARRLLEQYAELHPHGANAADVERLLKRDSSKSPR